MKSWPGFLAFVALVMALAWSVAPVSWTDTSGCGGVLGTPSSRVNAKLDQVLGPTGTLVTEELLHAVLVQLGIEPQLTGGFAALEIGGVRRTFQRLAPGDSVWVVGGIEVKSAEE